MKIKLQMIFNYFKFKKLGYVPVFSMGLVCFEDYKDIDSFREEMNKINNPKKSYIFPNGRLGNCKMINGYKNTKGNIIHVLNKDGSIFANERTEYFYTFHFYGYENAPEISNCSLTEFLYYYTSLFYPELDDESFKVMNILTEYKPDINTEKILGVWTKECDKNWGESSV